MGMAAMLAGCGQNMEEITAVPATALEQETAAAPEEETAGAEKGWRCIPCQRSSQRGKTSQKDAALCPKSEGEESERRQAISKQII